MATIEVLANSRTDHGLVPLGAGRGYVPVLSFATATITATTTTTEIYAATIFGGTTSFANDVVDVPSAGIPVRGSARELLSVRTGSVG